MLISVYDKIVCGVNVKFYAEKCRGIKSVITLLHYKTQGSQILKLLGHHFYLIFLLLNSELYMRIYTLYQATWVEGKGKEERVNNWENNFYIEKYS